MSDAPAQPNPIDNRWRDSAASNLPPRHIGLFAHMTVAAQARAMSSASCWSSGQLRLRSEPGRLGRPVQGDLRPWLISRSVAPKPSTLNSFRGCLEQHRMTRGRFPPPWSVEEQAACFVVRDQNGQQLAYVYFENEPGRRSAAKLLTKDEARRIAVNIAKLPGLLSRHRTWGVR